MDQNELLDKMSAASTDGEARAAFREMHDAIDCWIHNKNFGVGLSEFLKEVSNRADTMHAMLAMAAFRLTWLWSSHIPEWNTSCDLVHAAFVARGLKADELMRGLRIDHGHNIDPI